jgi:hypothetical protein
MSTVRSAPPRRRDAVAETADDLQELRVLLIATLMDVAPQWRASGRNAPPWWLDEWARRLASERLRSPLRDEVHAWLVNVAVLIEEYQSTTAGDLVSSHPWRVEEPRARWLVSADDSLGHGNHLVERVRVEVSRPHG